MIEVSVETRGFLNSLFGDYEGEISFFLQDQLVASNDPAFITQNEGELRVYPANAAGVFFLFASQEDSERDAYTQCCLKPTVSLWRDGVSLFYWAFETAVADVEDIRLLAVMQAFDMVLDEPLPMPGTEGWEMVHADPDTFYTLDQLAANYLGEEPVAEASAVVYRDAKAITPYTESDYDGRTITVTLGSNQFSKKWQPQTIPMAGLVHQFTKHQVGPKDGVAAVFADMAPGQRVKKAVKSCTAIGLDIDNGVPSAVLDKAIAKLGCLAIRTSTHSHMKTRSEIIKDRVLKYRPEASEIDTDLMVEFLRDKERWDESVLKTVEYVGEEHNEKGIVVTVTHAGIPKHRLIVPLNEPFVIADEGRTQMEAMAKWAKVPAALATLLAVPFDRSCTDPSRLFYTPRHAEGRPFEISLFGGPLFERRQLQLENVFDAVASDFTKGNGKSKSVTPEGKKLGKWWKKYAHGFQIMDVIEDHCPDKKRSKATLGFNIECPFDEEHSNAGDQTDGACYAVNAAEGGNEYFFVKCQHEGCKDKTANDMLAKMITDQWFDKDVLTDPNFNIAEIEEDEAEPVQVAGVDDAIKSLTNPPNVKELEGLIVRIAEAKVTETQRGIWLAAVAKVTGVKVSDLKRDLKTVRERPKLVTPIENPQSGALVEKLSGEIGTKYEPPPLIRTQFHLASMDGGVVWLCGPIEDGVGEAYCTPLVVQGEAYFQDDGSRAIRVLVRSGPGEWKSADIKVAWLAQPSGTEAITALMNAGWKHRPKGRAFALEYLSTVEMPAIQVVGRPGWHDEIFVLPTGGTIPPDGSIELSRKVQLKAVAQSGSFEVWQKDVKWLFQHPKGKHFQCGLLIPYAGCVAGLLDDELLAFLFNGPSSTGKSECQSSAVSMFGDGAIGRGLFFSARTTENAAEGHLVMASGTVVAYDEVKFMVPNALQDLLFMAQSGMGKGRMGRDQEMRQSRRWRAGAVILSDEMSLGQRLSLGNVKIAAGLSVRVACIDFNGSHIFPTDEFSRIKRIQKNFGWGGPAFVEALGRMGYVSDPEPLRKRKDAFAAVLAEGCVKDHAMRLRAARIPAYIWLAAEVAKEAKLLPESYDPEKMARWVWKQMLESDIAPESASAKGLATLRSALMQRKDYDVLDYANRDSKYREAVAYHNASHKDHPGRKFFVIPSSKLVELSGGSATSKAMLDALDQEGTLVHDSDGSRTWGYFPGLGKVQYVVLAAEGIEAPDELEVPAPASKHQF
ncbi:hypothetical protein AYO42_00785 [Rhizomicrobium sp. SCGC AG-212-E05]|nr:hypothetical protein AYO42_00785 [Rhizomicrobium sp. SCGC AG-212-E05]